MSDSLMKTAPSPLPVESTRQTAALLPGRIVLKLANSRELMLFVLIALLVVGMTLLYPNNFPRPLQHSAVLLKRGPRTATWSRA
jgi:hypothetical protein